MFVLLIGDTNGGRNNFYEYACKYGRKNVIWVNNNRCIDASYFRLAVHFGGTDDVKDIQTITWSGDHAETLQRVYKCLDLK